MASLVKLKPFCKVFGKMAVVVTSMSHVGKKPREATIFGFTSVVQIAKWLLHDFSLEAVFLLGVWQGFCKSQWRSTCKSPHVKNKRAAMGHGLPTRSERAFC
jgi:hypothetical protein